MKHYTLGDKAAPFYLWIKKVIRGETVPPFCGETVLFLW